MGKKTKIILCIVLIINICVTIHISINGSKTEIEIEQEVRRRIVIIAKQMRYDILLFAWPHLTYEQYEKAYEKSKQAPDLKQFWNEQHAEWFGQGLQLPIR